MLLLKATERNWGLVGPGDWDRHSWKINEDGWYQYKESYRSGSPADLPEIPDMVEEGVLNAGQMERLKELLSWPWPETGADACDGTAWEFKMYEGDTVIKHRELGYIYGIEPYESIADMLTKESGSGEEETL